MDTAGQVERFIRRLEKREEIRTKGQARLKLRGRRPRRSKRRLEEETAESVE